MNIKSQYSLNMRPMPMVSPSKKSQSADGWMAFYPFNSTFPPLLVLSGMLRTVPIYRCSLMREEE